MRKNGTAVSIPYHRSVNAVAERLDISPRSVRRLIEDGSLRALKIGGQVRVSDEDLLDFLARCRKPRAQEV